MAKLTHCDRSKMQHYNDGGQLGPYVEAHKEATGRGRDSALTPVEEQELSKYANTLHEGRYDSPPRGEYMLERAVEVRKNSKMPVLDPHSGRIKPAHRDIDIMDEKQYREFHENKNKPVRG